MGSSSSNSPNRPVELQSSTLQGVPALPPHYLARQTPIEETRRLLINAKDRVVALVAPSDAAMEGEAGRAAPLGLSGMAGIGKSVLAAAVARDVEVRAHFPDGVAWVTVGQEPDILSLLSRIARALLLDWGGATSIEEARSYLESCLQEKACLLILDDVWVLDHVTQLHVVGEKGRLLITSRNREVLTLIGAIAVPVEFLSEHEALTLLTHWSGAAVTGETAARNLVRECGYLPLAVAIVGAMLRDGTSALDILDAFSQADLSYLSRRLAGYPYPTLLKALSVSIEQMTQNEPKAAECFFLLAVFPEDVAVPEATIVMLWRQKQGWADRVGRDTLTRLANRALVRVEGHSPSRSVRIHDLMHDYLRFSHPNISPVESILLDGYQAACGGDWAAGPDDGYFLQHITKHLCGSKRFADLQTMLLDLRWMERKLLADGMTGLVSDYADVQDPDLLLIRDALRLSAHVLSQDSSQLSIQLTGRLRGLSPTIDQCTRADQYRIAPFNFRILGRSLTAPDSPLLCTLTGHTGGVRSLAISPDGKWLLSVGMDRVLRVWDLQRRELVRSIEIRGPFSTVVAAMPSGTEVAVGYHDGSIELRSIDTGEVLRTFAERETRGSEASYSAPDGQH